MGGLMARLRQAEKPQPAVVRGMSSRRKLPRAEPDAPRYLRLRLRLQVIRERTVLANGAGRAGRWPALMQAVRRYWFWILTGLMMLGTGLWYLAAQGTGNGPG